MSAIVRGVGCPSCGGSLEIREGTTLLNCQFCATGLMVSGDHGIPRFYVPLRVTKEQILEKVYAWFGKIDKAPHLLEEAKIAEMFPIYVPFWRINSKVIGWVLGDEKRGSGKSSSYHPVEKRVNQDYEFTTPACDIGEFGVKWVDLKGDEIRPFDLDTVQSQGMTFGIMSTPTEAKEQCEEQFVQWGESSAGVDRVTFKWLHNIGSTCTLVYYPLWIIRYQYKNRTYQISADAESAQLLYGRAPGNNLYRVGSLIACMMAGNLIVTSALRGLDGGVFGAIVAGVVVMVIGFRKFRYGGEVKIEQSAKSKSDTFSKVFDELKAKIVKE
jgi:hypothetical protein